MADEVKNESTSTEVSEDKEVKEETPVAEEAKAEEVKTEEAPAEKAEPTGKFADLIKQIEGLSALELSELVKALEERFGVSAAAPVAVAAGAPAAGAAEAEEEKANYNVILKDGGSNKIAAIKAVREVRQDLGLKEAKDLVDGAPKPLKENVPTEEAKEIKEKIEAAGATVELQ
jgi:large subunit ribosomal protein L7/L12